MNITLSMTIQTDDELVVVPEHEITLEDIGKTVKTVRKHLKLTQEKLGELTDQYPSCISLIEQGKEIPQLVTLVALLEGVGHSLELYLDSSGEAYRVTQSDIGQTIRALRRRLGVKQIELAELLEMHSSHISGIEKGKVLPRVRTLFNIIYGLGTVKVRLIPNASTLCG